MQSVWLQVCLLAQREIVAAKTNVSCDKGYIMSKGNSHMPTCAPDVVCWRDLPSPAESADNSPNPRPDV